MSSELADNWSGETTSWDWCKPTKREAMDELEGAGWPRGTNGTCKELDRT